MANSEKEPAGVPAPLVLAMILCDHVWQDPNTGKETLLGCFEVLEFVKFPVEFTGISLYVAMTGGRGVVPLLLEITKADDEDVVYRGQSAMEFADPRAVRTFVLEIARVELSEPGEYNFDLYAGNNYLMTRRLFLAQFGKE